MSKDRFQPFILDILSSVENRRAISVLRALKLIWNFIIQLQRELRIEILFVDGKLRPVSWIIKSINSINSEKVGLFDNDQNLALTEINSLINRLETSEGSGDDDWNALKQILEDPKRTSDFKKVASIIYCENEESRHIIEQWMLQTGSKYVDELSIILLLYYPKTSIHRFVENHIDSEISPIIFHQLNDRLQSLGFNKFGKELLRAFLHEYESKGFANSSISASEIRDLIDIAKYLEDTQAIRRLSKCLEHNQKLEDLVNKVNAKNQNHENLLDFDEFCSLHLIIESGLLDEEGLFEELVDAFQLHKADAESARTKLIRFFRKNQLYAHGAFSLGTRYEWLINPIEITKLFIKLKLISEAIQFLKIFENTDFPLPGLARFRADVLHKYGHHKQAVNDYFDAYLTGCLTRSEKKKYAESLAHNEDWEKAILIEKTINSLDSEEQMEEAFAAYKNGDAEFLSTISTRAQNYLSSTDQKIIQAMERVLGGNISGAKDSLADQLNKKNLTPLQIGYIGDILRELQDVNLLNAFLRTIDKSSSSQALLIKIKTYLQRGEMEKARIAASTIHSEQFFHKQKHAEELIRLLTKFIDITEIKTLVDAFYSRWPLSFYLGEAKITQCLECSDFNGAEQLIRKLELLESNWEEGPYLFGLSVLKSKPSEFPLRAISEGSISKNSEEAQKKMLNELAGNDQVLSQLMRIELSERNKLAQYEKFLSKTSIVEDPDYWRILLGASLSAIDEKRFDQAIKFLLELQKLNPELRIIQKLLVEAYANLHLYDDAIQLLDEQLKLNDFLIEDLLGFSEKLHGYPQFIAWLERKYFEEFQAKFKIAAAWCFYANGNSTEAQNALNESEMAVISRKNEMLWIADIYQMIHKNHDSVRVINLYLSNQSGINSQDLHHAAAICYRQEHIEKSLNLLNLDNKKDKKTDWIKVIIYKDLDEISSANSMIDEIISKYQNPFANNPEDSSALYETPENWRLTDQSIMVTVLDVKTKTGDLDSIYQYFNTNHGERKNTTTELIAFMQLSLLLGKEFELPDGIESDELITGHLLLDKAELMSANILMKNDALAGHTMRIALQSRMMIRNSNRLEAKRIYDDLKKTLLLEQSSTDSTSNFRSLIEKFIFIETALENNDFGFALSASRNILMQNNLLPGFIDQYVRSLATCLVINKIYKNLEITQHAIPIEDQDKNLLDELSIRILKNQDRDLEDFLKIIKNQFSDEDVISREDIDQILSETQYSYLLEINESMLEAEKDQGNGRKALLDLLENGETHPEVHYALAMVNRELGDLSGSYSAVSIAVDNWPDEYNWQVFAGKICEGMKNFHLAAKHYSDAQKLNPEINEISSLQGRINKIDYLPENKEKYKVIEDYISRGQYEKAEDKLNEIISTDPHNFYALKLSGMNSIEMGDIDKAIDLLLRGLALAPFDKEMYTLLGNAFESKRDIVSAGNILLEGAKLLSNDLDLNIKAGLLLYKYGKNDEALPAMKRALELDNENKEIRRLVELLSRTNADEKVAITIY